MEKATKRFDQQQMHYVRTRIGVTVEEIFVRLVGIRYRDSKGRISKFTSKKKLSIEVLMTRKLPNQQRERPFVSSSYGFALAKRKYPTPLSRIQAQITKKHKQKIKKGHGITRPQFLDGFWRWSYFYTEKQRERAKARAKARAQKRKGQKHGGGKTKRHQMSKR